MVQGPLSRCVQKVPRRWPKFCFTQSSHPHVCKALSKLCVKGPLFLKMEPLNRGFKDPPLFAKETPSGFLPKSSQDAGQLALSANTPRCVQELFTKPPPCCQIPDPGQCPCYLQKGPIPEVCHSTSVPDPAGGAPPLWVLKVAKLFIKGLLLLQQLHHPSFSGPKTTPRGLLKPLPHAVSPPWGGGRGGPSPRSKVSLNLVG